MATKTPDPLVAVLGDLPEPSRGGTGFLLASLFADRPAVLDSIKSARSRGRSFVSIADALSSAGERPVSAAAVRNWCRSQGVR